MRRGKAFKDDHRIVLMLIRQRESEVEWYDAAEVFNLVFPDEHPRTIRALQQQMYRRRNNQREAWDSAFANRTEHNRLAQAVEAAFADLAANPYRRRKTVVSKHTMMWDHDMRLVCHLLMEDGSVDMSERARIFNTLFRDTLINRQGVGVSENALIATYARRFEEDKPKIEKAEVEEEPQSTPVKKRKQYVRPKTKPSVAESWEAILSESEKDRATAWQEKIEAQKGRKSLTGQKASSGPADEEDEQEDEEEDEEDDEDEDEEVEEDEDEEVEEDEEDDEAEVEAEPASDDDEEDEEADYNPDEDVGSWRFGHSEDARQASYNLGAQLPGMPAHPSAADVRRYTVQRERAGRRATLAEGIDILPAPEDQAESVQHDSSQTGSEASDSLEIGDIEGSEDGMSRDAESEDDDSMYDGDNEEDAERAENRRILSSTSYAGQPSSPTGGTPQQQNQAVQPQQRKI